MQQGVGPEATGAAQAVHRGELPCVVQLPDHAPDHPLKGRRHAPTGRGRTARQLRPAKEVLGELAAYWGVSQRLWLGSRALGGKFLLLPLQ